MVKHTQTIRRLLQTNCLSVFDYFVGLVPKGLLPTLSHLKTNASFPYPLKHSKTRGTMFSEGVER